MDWNKLQSLVSELELADQVRFAELKGVEVPEEVRAQVTGELAAEEAQKRLAEHVRFQFGTANQTDRVYLKTKGFTISVDGKPKYSKGLFLETRGIDEALAALTKAQAECKERGIPTGPTDSEANPGMDVPRRESDLSPRS